MLDRIIINRLHQSTSVAHAVHVRTAAESGTGVQLLVCRRDKLQLLSLNDGELHEAKCYTSYAALETLKQFQDGQSLSNNFLAIGHSGSCFLLSMDHGSMLKVNASVDLQPCPGIAPARRLDTILCTTPKWIHSKNSSRAVAVASIYQDVLHVIEVSVQGSVMHMKAAAACINLPPHVTISSGSHGLYTYHFCQLSTPIVVYY